LTHSKGVFLTWHTFETYGRKNKIKQIPATESGIEAAARLQREDGINVNLTFVSGVIHATACAQSGAVAVTIPIVKVSFFFLFSAFFPSFLAYTGRTQSAYVAYCPYFCVYRCAIGADEWTLRTMLSGAGKKSPRRSPLILTCTASPPRVSSSTE
jgi:Transaldolase/Fructose-6-phosphate aldolase